MVFKLLSIEPDKQNLDSQKSVSQQSVNQQNVKGLTLTNTNYCFDKHCRESAESLKNDNYMNTLGDFKKGRIMTRWVGTAPFCDPNACDLYEEGYFPYMKDSHGDGKGCWKGKKILGVKPSEYTEKGIETLQAAREKCQDFRIKELGEKLDPVKASVGILSGALGV